MSALCIDFFRQQELSSQTSFKLKRTVNWLIFGTARVYSTSNEFKIVNEENNNCRALIIVLFLLNYFYILSCWYISSESHHFISA